MTNATVRIETRKFRRLGPKTLEEARQVEAYETSRLVSYRGEVLAKKRASVAWIDESRCARHTAEQKALDELKGHGQLSSSTLAYVHVVRTAEDRAHIMNAQFEALDAKVVAAIVGASRNACSIRRALVALRRRESCCRIVGRGSRGRARRTRTVRCAAKPPSSSSPDPYSEPSPRALLGGAADSFPIGGAL